MEGFLNNLEDISVFASELRFHYLRIGPLCNGIKSVSFTDAKCDLTRISYLPKTRVTATPETGYIFVKLGSFFKKGFDIIRSLKNDPKRIEDLNLIERKAFEDLFHFFQQKETVYAKLSGLLKTGIQKNEDKAVKTEKTVALAAHLLQELAPDQTFVIDKYLKDKKMFLECKCGCRKEINYGNTGMGHEKVWHGYMDIVFHSPYGFTVGVVVTEDVELTEEIDRDEPLPKLAKIEDTTNLQEEVKQCQRSRIDIVNQSTAQSIVCSLLQKNENVLNNYLIPTLLITPTSFRIIMYDADNDILIRSASNPLYVGDTFSDPAVLILWMVLHYKLFCSGFPEDLSASSLDYLKSGFKEHVCNDIYLHELKSCVGSFSVVAQERVDDDDDVFKQGVEFPKLATQYSWLNS